MPDEKPSPPQVEEKEISGVRRNWLCFVRWTTWWIPERCLIRRMDRPDVRLAWREKVALFIIILMVSGIMLFFIMGFGKLLCPRQYVMNMEELATRNTMNEKYHPMVALYGNLIDISVLAKRHQKVYKSFDDSLFIDNFAGADVTSIFWFPLQDCGQNEEDRSFLKGLDQQLFPRLFNETTSGRMVTGLKHDPSTLDKTLKMLYKRENGYYYGSLVWDMEYLTIAPKNGYGNYLLYKNEVFDLSDIIQDPSQIADLDKVMEALFPGIGTEYSKNAGMTLDWTDKIEKLNASKKSATLTCLRHRFRAGIIDTRKSAACKSSEVILLSLTGLMVMVILVKFLSALQLGHRRLPEQYDKFVIIQIPCYTEGEESLRRTIDSVSITDYDDKRKLLFIIADGMIIGGGNDRPTPRIVLDILGVDPNLDPEPVAYRALGEGNQQLNMAKVFSGLYEVDGHVVPYVVVIKCGKQSERSRPGNRGKRDSQLILLRFLNRALSDEPMEPMELEIFHQLKNVIGVDPEFYEYILMVDADTEVLEDSITRLVAACIRDTNIMGICGETMLANADDSWVTMIQVYEYYISHHLSKAFESLFGAVTCLPGCFCMYRIKSHGRNKPLIVSQQVIKDYSENDLDTLHKKNLLSLGEDRYLTTLMLKHFPNLKMTFISDSKCKTFAPERWNILLSQRRRWINSTVHNLFELLTLDQLCGFCVCSMRFVVFIDLFATLVQPATVCYLVYLVCLYFSSGQDSDFYGAKVSLIMLCVVYGLQAIIFLLKRRWEHIGWMILYILGIPLFSFFIPLYSFWHFDDFSWGNTRVVVGEGGKKKVIHGEGDTFNPEDIPMVKWSQHQDNEIAQDCNYAATVDSMSETSSLPDTQSLYRGGFMDPYQQYMPSSANEFHRMSLASSMASSQYMHPLQMQPPSNSYYPYPQNTRNEGGMMNISGATDDHPNSFPIPVFPSDEEIYLQVSYLLQNNDLSKMTKKRVRRALAHHFGVDMNPKREFINECIKKCLSQEADW